MACGRLGQLDAVGDDGRAGDDLSERRLVDDHAIARARRWRLDAGQAGARDGGRGADAVQRGEALVDRRGSTT